jgi:hypothetical protein
MTPIEEIIANMRRNPQGIRFRDLCRVCDFSLGRPARAAAVIVCTKRHGRVTRESIYIQNDKGMAKPYQVRQVLRAIDRLEADRGTQK